MAIKLVVKQNGQIRELPTTQNGVTVDANARTHFQLVDDTGNLVQQYQSRILGDKLLIDLPNTPNSPDFIINQYTTYFGNFPVGNTGYFGASDAAASVVQQTATTPAMVAPSTSDAVATSETVKASTVNVGSGVPSGVLWAGAGLAGVVGLAAAVSGGAKSAANDAINSVGGNDNNANNSADSQNNSTANSGSSTASTNNSGSNNPTNAASNNAGNHNHSGVKSSGQSQSVTQSAHLEEVVYNKDVLHGNKIELPKTYTKEILQGSNLQAIAKAATGGVALNQYQHSEADKQIKITDLNNLSRELQTELSLFVAGLLNPIREKWQVGLFKVTDGAIDFAKDVANEYSQNQQSIFTLNGHYVAGIKRAAAKYGLNANDNYYEDLGGVQFNKAIKNFTLDDLKMEIYDSVVRMLFDDAGSQQGHAKSLLNRQTYEDQNAAVDYLGVDISSASANELSWHFIKVADHAAYVKDVAKFNQAIATNEIIAQPENVAQAYVLDENNSYLATKGLNSETSEPQITQKFTLSKLLDGGIRQLSNEYDPEDVLVLDSRVFTALNTDKSNLNQHINYDSQSGKLQYDADGVGGEPAVVIAQLPTGLQDNQLNFEVI